MSSVSSSVELRLDKDERELLERAIAKIDDISTDCCNADLFLDADGVFFNLYEDYRHNEGKLSAIIDISE